MRHVHSVESSPELPPRRASRKPGGLRGVDTGQAVFEQPLRPGSERLARLGTALARMASELSSAQRENLRLRRENATLRRRLDELDRQGDEPA